LRDYAKVAGTFWTGATGRALKSKGKDAVIVGLYLMTCPNSNMLGLYWLPRLYIEHETGLGSEGASEGLARAIEVGFCEYDEASEVVWVKEMAAYQIADTLKSDDNRCKGIQREYDQLPENPYLARFYERYGVPFHMTACRGKQKGLRRGLQAPTKPRAGTGTGTEPLSGFAEFWLAYPRKDAKEAAVKAFQKIAPDAALLASMLNAIKAQGLADRCAKGEKKFVPMPATWLNGKRWQDEPGTVPADDIFAGAR
jgi:hypothetical protein